MQEEKHEGKEAEAPVKKKSRTLLIVAGIVLAVLVIGGAAGGYFFLVAPKNKQSTGISHKTEVGQPKGESGGKNEGEGKGEGLMKPMEPFVVNLTDAQGTRYLKAVMQFEMDNEVLSVEFDRKAPVIRDDIIMLLSSKSFDDLSTIPGKRALKRGIIDGVNRYLTTGKVVNVFFSEFVIQ